MLDLLKKNTCRMTDKDLKNDKWNTLPEVEKLAAGFLLDAVAKWMYDNNMTWLGRKNDSYVIDIRIEKKEIESPDA